MLTLASQVQEVYQRCTQGSARSHESGWSAQRGCPVGDGVAPEEEGGQGRRKAGGVLHGVDWNLITPTTSSLGLAIVLVAPTSPTAVPYTSLDAPL